jgi:hypothetical protein
MNTRQEALTTLDQLAEVRRRTLEPFHSLWYPVLLYGVLCLASAPIYELAPSAAGLYWLVAVVGGWLAISRYYARRGRSAGLGRPSGLRKTFGWWLGVYLAVVVVCSVGATLDSPSTIVVGITAIIGIAYIVIARQAHNGVVAAAGIAIVATGIAVAASGTDHPYTITMLVMGAILSLTGLYLHAQEQSRE